ncbi:dihydrofolate reductase [Bacillus sp. 491mf]|uniref:dihydrofolate reductase n=1 Tax=Bacillus sp. 491mf TaxID=1761755 RepID=UPI00114D43F3|nr:dihydrofolate reductase [Bacillus sp. 491mf]
MTLASAGGTQGYCTSLFVRKIWLLDDLTVPIVLFIPVKSNNRNTHNFLRKLPNDWAYLRRVTRGHSIILGKKNYGSIGKPLDGCKRLIETWV